MQIIRNLKNIPKIPPLSLTIGNFDGVHLGHLEIIEEMKKNAEEQNLAPAILTFEPHPVSFFNEEKRSKFRITNLAQKLQIFRELGVKYCIILPFNQSLSELDAEDFIVKILLKKLNAKNLIVGYDFIFGKNRGGNFELLQNFSAKSGFNLSKIEAKKNGEEIFSSSLIRKEISNGNIAKANQLLNKKFTIYGNVIRGQQLASKLGFPTANILPKAALIQPKFGVYKTSTFIPKFNKKFSSITNFGIKPTLQNQSSELFENHIFNFSENLYGQKIYIEFEDFIRDEKKFASLAELKEQIAKDVGKINL